MKTKLITIITRGIVFYISVVLLSGCGTSMFVSPLENPIIEDKVGYSTFSSGKEQLGTLATTAQRRIVLVKLAGNKEGIGRFCAEPSPDAADNLASTLSLVLKAKIKTPKTNVDAGADLARELSTTVQKLAKRSQGLQFFRDGMYNLCQSFLNGAITSDVFYKSQDQLMNISAKLIETELKYKDSTIVATAVQELNPEELLAAKRTRALESLRAKNALQAEKASAELSALTANNALLEEKDRAELVRKQSEIEMANKNKELESALKENNDSEAAGNSEASGDSSN